MLRRFKTFCPPVSKFQPAPVEIRPPGDFLDPHIIRHVIERAQSAHPYLIGLIEIDDHPRLLVGECLEVHVYPANRQFSHRAG